MNAQLTAAETDAPLEMLDKALVQIRMATWQGDLKRAEAIADAVHNVPRLLCEGDRHGWTVSEFRRLFLAPLIEN